MAKKVEEEFNLFYLNNSGTEKKSVPQNNKTKKRKNKNQKKNEKIKRQIEKNNSENKKVKTKKRRISKKKVAIFIAKCTSTVILIAGAIIFMTTTPIFNIKNINIIGNEQVSNDQIISLSGVKVDTNIFKNSKLKIAKNIKQNSYIKEAVIKRKLPDTIQIEIEEKTKVFMLQFVNGYAYIDNQGYILEISSQNIDIPIIKGYITSEEDIVEGNRLYDEDLEKLEIALRILQAFKDTEIDMSITNIDITDKQEYTLYIESEKKVIYLGDGSNLIDKMLFAKAILEAEKGNEGEIFLNGDLNNKFQPYFREKV